MKTKIIFLYVIVLFSTNAFAEMAIRPESKYGASFHNHYGWVCSYKRSQLCISVNKTAARFISSESLELHFRQKTKNFDSNYKWSSSVPAGDTNFMKIHVELNKYPEKPGMYYGLISLELEAAVAAEFHSRFQPYLYVLVSSIAGSDTSIVPFITEELDHMIGMFAEDYKQIEAITQGQLN